MTARPPVCSAREISTRWARRSSAPSARSSSADERRPRVRRARRIALPAREATRSVGVAGLVVRRPDGTFGNRYDDPEASYRVLYASSQRIGAFLETLARFRPDLEVIAELDLIEGEDEPPPAVPRSWLDNRLLGEATVAGRFVDVADTTSLATLRTTLAASAIRHGLDEIDA